MSQISPIQALYDQCKKACTPVGIPPSSPVIQNLCSLMDKTSPADVGLREDNSDDDRCHGFLGHNSDDNFDMIARWDQSIKYLELHENESFTMCIFRMPKSTVMPLHDHPGMTVLSKLLYGSLNVKAYDWVEPACIQNSRGPGYRPVKLAKLVVDHVRNASSGTSVLYPKSGGNIHCFSAVTTCAAFDILTPSYREAAGSTCTFYLEYPYSSFHGASIIDGKEEDYAWLEVIDTPNSLCMLWGEYKGFTIKV
ncbi:plant cysteine oxidase 3-like isoform X2 [Macadamia integrifolia]|uniref:plant cysteine oxidase 3-like isoform X2 n=1 Tax=Macadamia integrifolia TaxID=60698 RepID=UPI001C4ECC8E|nr:plant cysteine oxidase 3-like isoform X2 [Macadamia integrifolia]